MIEIMMLQTAKLAESILLDKSVNDAILKKKCNEMVIRFNEGQHRFIGETIMYSILNENSPCRKA